jgi:soluble lytic murein transglycosylase-like protein
MRRAIPSVLACLALAPGLALAGAQQYEQLSASVRASLAKAVAEPSARVPRDTSMDAWVKSVLPRVSARMADDAGARELLGLVHYEALRAGLEPRLVLAIIDVESAFRKDAVSTAGARGYMQVMPFWVKLIGSSEQNLFHLRTNLRYGAVILRHYLDIENGDYYRALGRYNGSLGRPEYPSAVMAAMNRHFSYPPASAPTATAAAVGLSTPR